MQWQFNDGSSITIDHLKGYLVSSEIRLFCGSNLPTMELKIQYSDDYEHLILGDKVTGKISTLTSNYDIEGYVYDVKMGAEVNYKIILRPIEYFTEPVTKKYDSIKNALEDCETLDAKVSNEAGGVVHGFMDFKCNLVDRLASGYSKGVYGRSYNKLIIRNPEDKKVDYDPDINYILVNGVISQYHKKYRSTNVSNTDAGEVDNMTALYGNNSSVQCMEDYKNFYENAISNKKYNAGSTLELTCSAWLGFEPGLIIDTTKINSQGDENVPKIMYVRDVIINTENSGIRMKVVLME